MQENIGSSINEIIRNDIEREKREKRKLKREIRQLELAIASHDNRINTLKKRKRELAKICDSLHVKPSELLSLSR